MTHEEILKALGEGWKLDPRKSAFTKALGKFELSLYFNQNEMYVLMRQPLFFPPSHASGGEMFGHSYCFGLRYPRQGEPLDDIRTALKNSRSEVESWISALAEVAP